MQPIQVLQRAVAVLNSIGDGALSLSELVSETRLHKATAYNILRTLEELGVVARDSKRRYSIGPAIVDWARPILGRETLQSAADEACLWLSDRIGETVHVAMLRHGHRFVISRVDSTRTVTVNANTVEERNVYDGCSGPVLLAELSEDELELIVSQNGLPVDRWPGIKTARDLRKKLADLACEGVCRTVTTDGQGAILAIGVRSEGHRTVAAISVSLPTNRYMGSHRKEVDDSLRAAAVRMQERLALSLGD